MVQPNILLIVLDTARASHVYDQNVMPNLNQFADNGAKFTNAFTTGPWSLPSHASLFTGKYTSEHQTHANSQQFNPNSEPLASQLQSLGYHTVAFSNNVWISPNFGFDQGFDDFKMGWEVFSGGADIASIAKEYDTTTERVKALSSELLSLDMFKTATNALYSNYLRKMYDSGAWLTNRRAKQWIDSSVTDESPFFMFINYLEPHLEYDPPKKYIKEVTPKGEDVPSAEDINQDAWAYLTESKEMSEADFEKLKILYNGELRYIDERLNQLFSYLSDKDMLEETFVIVTGDHGENIGDHGLMDHQYCLYDSLLNVPLIFRYPDVVEPVIREDIVELRDVYSTILQIADSNTADTDIDILQSLGREAAFSEYWVPQPSIETLREKFGNIPKHVLEYDRGLQAIRTPRWKYIEGTDGSSRLFDLESDCNEKIEVSDEQSQLVNKFRDQLQDRFDDISNTEPESSEGMDTDIEDRLENLGYLQ